MANSVIIGELDTQVTVEKATMSRGTRGEVVTTFTSFSTPWAKVERNIDETIANENLEEGKSLNVTVYKADVSGISTRWRVKVDNVPYEVRGIDPIDRLSPFCILTIYSIQ